ncbi:hypothetical protein H0H93_008624 [Arthromyces matolae]|nr:hypothetical protein H0H93_008624 [Arthromyces matolae]
MSATPGRSQQSGIPGPIKPTGIPTPGRSRASSTVLQQNAAADVEYMSRAFAEAIKANDPAQHRQSLSSVASLSPQSASFSQSGSRSAAGRPSSVLSASSSLTGNTHPRSKTPVQFQSRPSSRISEGRKTMNTTKGFEIGDNVRIESLGFEGSLRYLGSIEGKQGTWAGVQLSGGFSGKEKCGVFVSVTKLSAPTVGPGAAVRPPSVASSSAGGITPAPSGRLTPSTFSSITGPRASLSSSSLSNGRTTPSTDGRITPSFSSSQVTPGHTPAARVRRPLTKSTSTKVEVPVPIEKFTAGSRASKYINMTAKQLSSRDGTAGSPSRRHFEMESPTRSLSSPSYGTRSTASPTRAIGSPFATPKPGLNGRIGVSNMPTPSKIRSSGSLGTPRARIPSSVAMPPPPSPMTSLSVTDHSAGGIDALGLDADSNSPKPSSIRPNSAASIPSPLAENHVLLEQLHSRINTLEIDNERLRALQFSLDTNAGRDDRSNLEDARTMIASLEASLSESMSEKAAQNALINALEADKRQLDARLECQNRSKELDLATLQSQLDTERATMDELRSSLSEYERLMQQKESVINTKEQDIASLQSRLAAVTTELQTEKLELGAQIDELRTAGQETIALYEERLSAADGHRYDLEQRISLLETGLQDTQKAASPPPSSAGTSAAEIDNETLREQITHLQRKVATLEDTIEDAQAAAEKEEFLMRDRMKRLKEKEDAMRKELNEGRKEAEQILKSEVKAKNRIEEIEEALRESTVALENARAEVETLRSELANLDGLVANNSGGDLFSRVAEVIQRAAMDKAHHVQEIAQLEDSIDKYRHRERSGGESSDEMTELQQVNLSVRVISSDQALCASLCHKKLRETINDQETRLTALSQSLDDTSRELEALRKKHNRDVTINNGLQEALRPVPLSPSSKNDAFAAKEEITGLKHIVQELQKENVAALQRIKLLESENQLLTSETDQLRQEVQILEENLDKSLDQDDIAVKGINEDSPRNLREQKGRLEIEQEQLRKRLVEVEMKSTRTIHDLNKEISELEALVESKVESWRSYYEGFGEDELEQEVERLREKLARQEKKMSKGSVGVAKEGEVVCEICERPGHDIFGCDVLNKGGAVKMDKKEPFCEDCDSSFILSNMSYASVAAANAPQLEQQPQPDPVLLNTTPPSAPTIAQIDETANRINLVSPEQSVPTSLSLNGRDNDDDSDDDDDSNSKKKIVNRHLQEIKAEGFYLWQITKQHLFQPGVAGGLIGLGGSCVSYPVNAVLTVIVPVNLGLLIGVGHAFYTQPSLRRDRGAVSSTFAAALALLSVEGYAAERYRKTPRGQAEEKRAREEGTLVYKHIREHLVRPGVLGGIIGLSVLGAVGYLSYAHWERPTWDRRVVSAVSVGLLTLWGAEACIVEKYKK